MHPVYEKCIRRDIYELLMFLLDPRPPYSGVATVNNVFRDEFDRVCLGVSLPGGKSICCVPGNE